LGVGQRRGLCGNQPLAFGRGTAGPACPVARGRSAVRRVLAPGQTRRLARRGLSRASGRPRARQEGRKPWLGENARKRQRKSGRPCSLLLFTLWPWLSAEGRPEASRQRTSSAGECLAVFALAKDAGGQRGVSSGFRALSALLLGETIQTKNPPQIQNTATKPRIPESWRRPVFFGARETRLWVPHQLPHVGFGAFATAAEQTLCWTRTTYETPRGLRSCYAGNHRDHHARESRQTARNRHRVSVPGTRQSGCRDTGSGNEPCKNGSGRGDTGRGRTRD